MQRKTAERDLIDVSGSIYISLCGEINDLFIENNKDEIPDSD